MDPALWTVMCLVAERNGRANTQLQCTNKELYEAICDFPLVPEFGDHEYCDLLGSHYFIGRAHHQPDGPCYAVMGRFGENNTLNGVLRSHGYGGARRCKKFVATEYFLYDRQHREDGPASSLICEHYESPESQSFMLYGYAVLSSLHYEMVARIKEFRAKQKKKPTFWEEKRYFESITTPTGSLYLGLYKLK